MKHVLDETDLKIISLLENNARRSMKDIAEKIHMSQPAVKERIIKLEEKGVIVGYTVLIDQGIHAFFHLTTTNCLSLETYCQQQSAIAGYFRITGEYNYLIEARGESLDELSKLQEKLVEFGPSKMYLVSKNGFKK